MESIYKKSHFCLLNNYVNAKSSMLNHSSSFSGTRTFSKNTGTKRVFLLEDSGTKFCLCTIVPGIKGRVRSIHLLTFVNTTFELGPSSYQTYRNFACTTSTVTLLI